MSNKESLQNTPCLRTYASEGKEYLELPLFVNRGHSSLEGGCVATLPETSIFMHLSQSIRKLLSINSKR